MTFFKRINTILNTKISPFINNCIFRYYHHHSLHDDYLKNIPKTKTKIIINLLGDFEYVNTASWEMYFFSQEKQLPSANIVHHDKMLKDILYNNYLQFIVNRCYSMTCEQVLYLNQNIMKSKTNWQPYNLYVMPDAKNNVVTCDFIQKCSHSKFIIYPLAATAENKRRDINKLIKDIEK